MPYDLVIKNGMVIDGTGFSRYRADIAIKDGAIAETGRITGPAAATIDAEGLYVSPGVIDLHTHYDAQPFWDKLCTSSIWHGVTTVLTGNCGLTLAPLRPEHREAMLATFCCVEDLPVKSLAAVTNSKGSVSAVHRRAAMVRYTSMSPASTFGSPLSMVSAAPSG